MSNKAFLSTDISTLTQRLQSAEKSIKFLQHEHASTLASLHEEISKWQQKFSDLIYQLAIGDTVTNSIVSDLIQDKLRTTVEQLENELHQSRDQIKALNKVLEEKEKIVNDYENRLIVNDQKHASQLRKQYDKQRELKIEIERYSIWIADLTDQLLGDKQHQQNVCNPVRRGHIMLPNKPRRFKNIDEQRQQHLPSRCRSSNRSLSVSNRTSSDQELTNVLFIGRPSTFPQQSQLLSSNRIESNNEQFLSRRQRQLLNSHTGNVDSHKVTSSRPTIKFSTVLPPIVSRKIPLKAMAIAKLPCEGEA